MATAKTRPTIGMVSLGCAKNLVDAEIMLGGAAKENFDLTREPDAVRDRYGRNQWGQQCLMARRLVEAGSKFVTVIWDAYGLNAGSWDTHHNHYGRLKEFLLPVFDQSFSALILDPQDGRRVLLAERGEATARHPYHVAPLPLLPVPGLWWPPAAGAEPCEYPGCDRGGLQALGCTLDSKMHP